MRKRYRVLFLAALVAALVVPLGFALSLESTPAVVAPHTAEIAVLSVSAKTDTPLLVAERNSRSLLPPIPDGAKLFVIGSALFGIAAAMRRAA
jgi:hypothetical protein